MRFNIEHAPRIEREEVQVGDVYPARASGPKFYRQGTRYFLVAAITPGRYGGGVCHLLGLDEHGNINSTTSYGLHVMEARERIGYCPDMASAELNIEWEGE